MKTIPNKINDLPVLDVISEFLIEVGEDDRIAFISLDMSDFMKDIIYTLLEPSFSETEENNQFVPISISANVASDEIIKERIIELAENFKSES